MELLVKTMMLGCIDNFINKELKKSPFPLCSVDCRLVVVSTSCCNVFVSDTILLIYRFVKISRLRVCVAGKSEEQSLDRDSDSLVVFTGVCPLSSWCVLSHWCVRCQVCPFSLSGVSGVSSLDLDNGYVIWTNVVRFLCFLQQKL